VKADPGQVEQLIMNLAVNARDAMPQGGQLVIETRNAEISGAHLRVRDGMQPGRYVMLVVSDTGVGMDNETQAHMFEPFFTTKEPGKGTGLGLPIVYGVVKQTGGWTHVESKPGQGTTFEIYLPCAEETETKGPASVPGLQGGLAAAPKGTETILLVEDESGIRELAGEFLRRQGYTVLHAMDGNEALRIAGDHKDLIHLLVTDMAMPNLGGKELASRLRQLRPQIQVLFMSGYPDHPTSADGDVGAPATLLQKPFSLDTLAHKVRTLLDQK
jgi:two-component system cell cycle sensor histidine kinase/response regulator CckA